MRIGVISDTHGSYSAWEKALSMWGRVDIILHAGDVLYHGPRNKLPEGYNPQRLADSINNCKVPIILTRGNCDSPIDMELVRKPFNDRYSLVAFGELFIFVHHGDRFSETDVMKIVDDYGIDIVISGHTHIYDIKRVGNVLFMNPGSPSLPKGSGIPSIGIIEDSIIRVLSLENGKTLLEEVIRSGSEDR